MSTWESDADRERERATAARLEAAWRVRAHPMPYGYPCDYVLHNPGRRTYAALEIKTRTCPSDKHPTLLIDYAKIARLWDFHRSTGYPAYLVASYADGVAGWVDLGALPGLMGLGLGGRTDRADPADIDLVAHLPREWFRRLP
jgi:hypothetical protein